MTDSLISFQDPLWGVLLRLVINTAVLFAIIYFIFFRFTKKKDDVFPFFLMGTMIFIICILLKKSEMNMGMALGLFAIFSIIRYRSENLVAKNLAYLFTVITVSVINAMFDFPHPVRGLVLVNLIIIVTVLLLELGFSKFSKDILTKEEKKALKKAGKNTESKEAKKAEKKKYSRHQVLYDNLGLLNPDKKNELLKDISKRTGIEIDKVRIRKIDLINTNAILDVYYKEKPDKAEE
jgi:hypothetical protein